MLKLTPQNVLETFKGCLFDSGVDRAEAARRAVVAEGINFSVGLDPDKLRARADDIDDLLDQLHPTFEKGWTFLNLCSDRDDNLWTGDHMTCQELMLLGIASGRITYCLPREFWIDLPGGVPYIILTPRKEST